MYLDQRGYLILKELANHPEVTGKELELSLSLSRKQIHYSLGKINAYLKEYGFEPIRWLKTGRFAIDLAVVREFQVNNEDTSGFTYVCSDSERDNWILLRLLCHKEELSTYHFIDELKISKNTLMGDFKRVQEIASKYELQLSYDRKNGYYVGGGEYKKRGLLIDVLRKILTMPGGVKRMCMIYGITQDELKQRKDDIREIEEKLSLQFTDERLEELPYILTFILLQIRNQNILTDLPEVCRQVTGTKEYMVMSSFCSKYGIQDEKEKIFFTVQIQISNIHNLVKENESNMRLAETVNEIIKTFERVSCVRIVEKDGLMEALIQHLGPAMCRIRYHYHVQPDITDMILPRYQYLHEMVRISASCLEEILQQKVPERELIYITALIGAWLKKEGTLSCVWPRKKAVVVCSNGVTVSHFLYITLKELFPEIDFVACLSARGFEEYQEEFQVVFTTVRLTTNKKQFLVNSNFNEYTRKVFRKKVLNELDGIHYEAITVRGIMELVDQYAEVTHREKLENALSAYLRQSMEEEKKAQNVPHNVEKGELLLRDLLPVSRIRIERKKLDWVDAIKEAAEPLWKKGMIEIRYIDRMISLISEEKPYIMLADGVIVAHAGVDDGVVKPGMSLLRLPERISIHGYMEADIILVLATPDRTVHLTALYQFLNLLENGDELELIRKTENISEIEALIERESQQKA